MWDSVMKGLATIIVLGGAMLMLMCSTAIVGLRKSQQKKNAKDPAQLIEMPQRFMRVDAMSLT
jgi:hypothetical protein